MKGFWNVHVRNCSVVSLSDHNSCFRGIALPVLVVPSTDPFCLIRLFMLVHMSWVCFLPKFNANNVVNYPADEAEDNEPEDEMDT